MAIDEMKKELLARPTEKMVDDLRKKVKILQVITSFYHILQQSRLPYGP